MRLTRTLVVVGAGAALAYFFDPISGRERREQLRRAWNERSMGALGGAPWPEPAPPPAAEPGPTVVVPESSSSSSSSKSPSSSR
jgi:hypothetical protein